MCAITGVAVSMGPVLGGVITTGISWRGIFLVNVPIGVVGVGVTLWQVEESKEPHPGRPDWAGFVLLTTGLVGPGLRARGASNRWTWSRSCASILAELLAGFLLAESRGRNPLFDLSLFRTPTFVGGLLAAFTMNGSLFAMFVYLVLYLQDILGYSAMHTGLCLLTSTGGMFFAATLSGRLSEHIPGPLADRARACARGTGPAVDDRVGGDEQLDALAARARHQRCGVGVGQPSARLDGSGGGSASTSRHGVRCSTTSSAAGTCHRHRRPRYHLRDGAPRPPHLQALARAGPFSRCSANGAVPAPR